MSRKPTVWILFVAGAMISTGVLADMPLWFDSLARVVAVVAAWDVARMPIPRKYFAETLLSVLGRAFFAILVTGALVVGFFAPPGDESLRAYEMILSGIISAFAIGFWIAEYRPAPELPDSDEHLLSLPEDDDLVWP